MRIALAGSVGSSLRALEKLVEHRMNVVGVLSLAQDRASKVSGFVALSEAAQKNGIPCVEFGKINDREIVEQIEAWNLDVLFVVGLSQLVSGDILKLPKLGCVGFHPTRLPEGRGRAPVAWLTMEERGGAATFFVMDEGADSGPILVQEGFEVKPGDYAQDVTQAMEGAIGRALDRWLPRLREGEWCPAPQVADAATYYGRRSPEDGLIDWARPAKEILRLVRASSRPHPGAYTYYKGLPLRIWRAESAADVRFRGVPGRILSGSSREGWLAQAGDTPILLREWEFVDGPAIELQIGVKFGFVLEDEIFRLRQRLSLLEEKLNSLAQTK